MELQLEYPKFVWSHHAIKFSHLFKLPFFKQIAVSIFGWRIRKREWWWWRLFTNNQNGLWLLQTIFNASKNLQTFVIPNSKSVVPMGFKYLRLPVRISVLELRVKLKNKDLESVLIWRNRLPNVTHLALQLHQIPFQDRLFFRILELF